MLNQKIINFITELKTLNANGCLTIPKTYLNEIKKDLLAAEMIVAMEPEQDKVGYKFLTPNEPIPFVKAPTLIVITEEDYSADDVWADKIRNVAGFFENLF